MSDSQAGWQPDPTGKHDHRYWDGSEWTENVSDAGVASTDPYDAADADLAPPEGPDSTEPTIVTPVGDTTDSYPTATTPPPAPPPYVPPTPTAGGGDGGSKRGLVIGGAILAAVAIAVVAFLALGGDDDEPSDQASNEATDASDEDNSTDGGDDSGDDGSEDGGEDLEALEADCADGDFAACDDLFFRSDLGSDLEEFGSTCGGIAEPQEGLCEATNGGEDDEATDGTIDGSDDGGFEDIIANAYEDAFGLSEEKAQCLAGQISGAIEDGELNEEQAMSEIFDYLQECDISLEEIQAN